MCPPWASTNALAMARPSPARPPPSVLAEHLEDALPLADADAGAVVRDGDLDRGRCAAWCDLARHPDDAADGRQAIRVLQKVGQNLTDEDMVDVQERKAGRLLDDDAAGPDEAVEGAERLGDQLIECQGDGAKFQRAGLNPGHVEEVGDEPGQPIRLQLNQFEQLVPVGRTELAPDLPQARDGRLDGGQRCPQIMGCRAHEGAAPAIDFLEQAGTQRLLGQFCPVKGQCRLVGEGPEEAPLAPRQFDLLEHQQADGMIAHRERDRDPTVLCAARHAERARRAAACGQAGDVAFGQAFSRRGSNPQHLTGCQRAATACGKDQCRPTWSEDALHRVDDVREQLRQIEVADERLRKLVQTSGLLPSAQGVLACSLQLRHHLGHDEDHDHVHQEGDPVLRRPDRERVVGGQEEEVVAEEPTQGAHDAGHEAAQHDAEERGQDEEQCRNGSAEVRAERQQDGEEDAQPDEGREHAHNAALIPSHGEPSWLHVCHCFPWSDCHPSVLTWLRAEAK